MGSRVYHKKLWRVSTAHKDTDRKTHTIASEQPMLRLTSDLNGTLRVPDEKTELTKNPSLCHLPCLALPISVDQSGYIIRVNPEVDPERIPGTVYTKDEVLSLICGQQRKDVVDKTGEASRVGNILHDKTYFIDGANFFRWEQYNGKGMQWWDWEFLHPDYHIKNKTNPTAWRRIVTDRGTHSGTEHQRIVAAYGSDAEKKAAMGDGDVIIVVSGVAYDNQFKNRWREVARVLLSFVKEEGHVNIIVTRPRECKQEDGKRFGFDRGTKEGFKEEDGIPRNVPCHALKRIPKIGTARRPDSKCVFYLIGNLGDSNDGAAVHNVGIETAKDGKDVKKAADGSKIYKREGEHRLCEYACIFSNLQLHTTPDTELIRAGTTTSSCSTCGTKLVKGEGTPRSGQVVHHLVQSGRTSAQRHHPRATRSSTISWPMHSPVRSSSPSRSWQDLASRVCMPTTSSDQGNHTLYQILRSSRTSHMV